MPYPCFLKEQVDAERQKQPGAVWFVPYYGPGGEGEAFFLEHLASEEYKRDWAGKRPPVCIRLPDGSAWPIDQQFNGTGGHGWVITGEAPNLTAQPSVNAVGSYHGWLRDGVLSDDIEGRTYPASKEQP